MNLNNEIDELRKPATQIISLFALFYDSVYWNNVI